MKALLVIAGFLAGLSTAHAVEKHDLVSTFKAACMGNEPFIEMVRKFAKPGDWHLAVRESRKDPQLTSRMGLAIAIPVGQKLQGTLDPKDTFTMIIAENEVNKQGEAITTCRVAQMKPSGVEPIGDRVDRVLGITGPPQPLSSDIRKYLVQNRLSSEAKQWQLSSAYIDYIILSEPEHSKQPTSLERVRVLPKEKP